MTWNGIVTIILRHFTELGIFRGPLRKMVEDTTEMYSQKI